MMYEVCVQGRRVANLNLVKKLLHQPLLALISVAGWASRNCSDATLFMVFRFTWRQQWRSYTQSDNCCSSSVQSTFFPSPVTRDIETHSNGHVSAWQWCGTPRQNSAHKHKQHFFTSRNKTKQNKKTTKRRYTYKINVVFSMQNCPGIWVMILGLNKQLGRCDGCQ